MPYRIDSPVYFRLCKSFDFIMIVICIVKMIVGSFEYPGSLPVFREVPEKLICRGLVAIRTALLQIWCCERVKTVTGCYFFKNLPFALAWQEHSGASVR